MDTQIDRHTDRHDQKHYLPTYAGGNNSIIVQKTTEVHLVEKILAKPWCFKTENVAVYLLKVVFHANVC